jgi:hypothetical protein
MIQDSMIHPIAPSCQLQWEETITDKRRGPGTGLLLLRGSIFSLVIRPYVHSTCVCPIVHDTILRTMFGFLSNHISSYVTLWVISQFRETLSLDKVMCTHYIYGPSSDGHGFTYTRKYTSWYKWIYYCNRVEEDTSGLTFQEWTSDVDTSRPPV